MSVSGVESRSTYYISVVES